MASTAATEYGWKDTAPPDSMRYIVSPVVENIVRLGARRVLDIGAGNGFLCAQLRQSGFDVVGIENDAAGVELVRASYGSFPVYHYGVQDDPRVLLEREAPFDVVVSTEVIEHLYAPRLLPTYAAAVLKQGGWLILTTPYHGYAKNVALSVAGAWDRHHDPLWEGGHIKFWSRRTLSRLLVDNGFVVSSFEGLGRAPFLWKSMLIVARRI
jgi:2-polyprenyl-3-methyl-5-hydroxy-6-metoxy-1,4-benzoquinol methylase